MKENRILKCLGNVDDRYVSEILDKSGSAGKGILRKHHLRKTLLIATLVVILGISALAIQSAPISWFHTFFSGIQMGTSLNELSQNQLTVLTEGLVDIGQSSTCNGYTITLESGISDGFRTLLKFKVTAPENVILDSDRYFMDIEFPPETHNKGGFISIDNGLLDDGNQKDNSIILIMEICCNTKQESIGSHTLLIHGISTVINQESDEEVIPLVEGNWEFKNQFPNNYLITQEIELLKNPIRCRAIQLYRNHTLPTNVNVTSFCVRTLSATLQFDLPSWYLNDYVGLEEIYLIMKDGSKIQAFEKLNSNRGSYFECTYTFDKPVYAEDVSFIEFPGTNRISVSP